MAVDVTKLNFYSGHVIDKVVQTGTITIINDGNTGTNYQQAKIVTDTVVNSYGRKVFARARWSVSGSSNNSLSNHVVYTFTITTPGPTVATLSGLKAALSIGVSDSTIYFRTGNGFHGDVTDDGISITYTPTSLTFTIDYVLYEKE